MLKIKIEDTETGQVLSYETTFMMANILTHGEDADSVFSLALGRANPAQLCKVFLAHDGAREQVFQEYPDVQFAWAMRDALFCNDEKIDLSELWKRAAQARGEDGTDET